MEKWYGYWRKIINILWHSAPAFYKTGYGVQTYGFVKQLQRLGHVVNVVSSFDTQDIPGMIWDGIPHLPGGKKPFGQEGAIEWSNRLNPDLLITLFDIWPFADDFGLQVQDTGVPWMPIVPVDCDPMHEYTFNVLKHASHPTAMSKFGLKQMKSVGLKPLYLPHGVDTEIFKPMKKKKELIRAKGKFTVGVVAANREQFDRKGLIQTFQAFAKFQKRRENSVLYFHGELSKDDTGVDLEWISTELGIKAHTTNKWMRWAFFNPSELAELYNTFDVFLLLTRGEGFCVPLIEAQACGVPVIVTDYTAPQDLVGAGWKIPIVDKSPILVRSYWGNPDIDAGVKALEEAYQMWAKKEDMIEKARKFALDYDFQTVADRYLVPILEKIENEQKKSTNE